MLAPVLALAMMPSVYQPKMVSNLYPECKAGIRAVDDAGHATNGDMTSATACLNYIMGFLEEAPEKVWRCNRDVTAISVARAFVRYVDAKPYYMKADAQGALTVTIIDSFPCPAK